MNAQDRVVGLGKAILAAEPDRWGDEPDRGPGSWSADEKQLVPSCCCALCDLSAGDSAASSFLRSVCPLHVSLLPRMVQIQCAGR